MHRSNITLIIDLVLNAFMIGCLFVMMFQSSGLPTLVGLLAGAALYIVSLGLALSPFGEWLLRLQTGCKKIYRADDLEYIMPLFHEVQERARQLDPSIPEDGQLFMNDDEEANAFATGRKTICITRGLMQMPPEQIKAALAHEFGHLAHKDTDLVLFVTVGNLIVTGIIILFRLVIDLLHWGSEVAANLVGGQDGAFALMLNSLCHAMTLAFVSFVSWVWSGVGTVLLSYSSRVNEYAADEFAFHLGFGPALCAMLQDIGDERETGLIARLSSSHPNKYRRIMHLLEIAESDAAQPAN